MGSDIGKALNFGQSPIQMLQQRSFEKVGAAYAINLGFVQAVFLALGVVLRLRKGFL